MIKYFVTVIALLLVVLTTPAQAQITVTNTFVAGDIVYAAQVNANFTDVGSNALNRTGGTITGNITVSAAVTIDGIDIGAVLGGTGTPTFTSVTYTTFLKSTTALATPSALSATQATAFASTVSGASIMGFGTTNDVSLMNRAGTVVLGVGPNTTAVNIPGTLAVTGAVTGDTYNSQTISSAANFTGTVGITGVLTASTYSNIKAMFETATVSATAATGTVAFDTLTQAVLYYTTNASGNWTLNVRGSASTSLNSILATGQSCTVAFLVTNGATAYYPTTFQVDGGTVTPKWSGGTAPTSGNASSVDIYTYTIVKTGSATFTVFASQGKFS